VQRAANQDSCQRAVKSDARTDAHLWAQTYDPAIWPMVSRFQSEIAKAIATSCKRSFRLTRRKPSSSRPL